MYRTLVFLTVAAHFTFIGYVVVGGLVALRWRRTFWLHLAAATWGLLVVVGHLDCPLTWLERWGRRKAGMAPLSPDGFVADYITGVLYPADWTDAVEIVVLAMVLLSWLLYLRRGSRLRRTPGIPWLSCGR